LWDSQVQSAAPVETKRQREREAVHSSMEQHIKDTLDTTIASESDFEMGVETPKRDWEEDLFKRVHPSTPALGLKRFARVTEEERKFGHRWR